MEIPKKLKYLVNLQNLWMSDNQIKEIPIEYNKFSGIAKIIFVINKIIEIPKKITNLVNLRILSLQSKNEVGVVIPIEITKILKTRDCYIYV